LAKLLSLLREVLTFRSTQRSRSHRLCFLALLTGERI
jgi:hypothetical protein